MTADVSDAPKPAARHERGLVGRIAARFDWQFIRGSSLIMLGITGARILGFAFSFLLARALSTDDFGAVQYTIALATLVAMLTIPFAEQVLPWFISHYRADAAQLAAVFSSGAFVLGGVTLLSLMLGAVVLALVDRLSMVVFVIFAGVTLFNLYAGLGRGFLAPGRLLAAYLGSNGVQLALVVVVVTALGSESAVPVLFVYGLSYLMPIALLQRLRPFPIVLARRHVRRDMVGDMLRFAAPSWMSHALYTITFTLDILLLERFQGEAAVGIYSLTKTIVMGFSFASQGMAMVLMPRIAGADGSNQRRLLISGLAITLAINLLALIPFALIYPWFVPVLVGTEYFIGLPFALLMATSAIIYSSHAVITSYLLGRKQPQLETASRGFILCAMLVSGLLLIPSHGAIGAAWAAVISATLGVIAYPLILWARRLGRKTRMA